MIRRSDQAGPEAALVPTADSSLGGGVDTIMGIVDERQIVEEIQATVEMIGRSTATATLKAYEKDWKRFAKWCADRGKPSLPADPLSVAVFLTTEAHRSAYGIAEGPPLSVSYIERCYAAIKFVHRNAGHPPPEDHRVRAALKGIVRTRGRAPQPKAALTDDLVARVVRAIRPVRRLSPAEADAEWAAALERAARGEDAAIGRTGRATHPLIDIRDRAMILLAFGGALRRSDLVRIRIERLEFKDEEVDAIVEEGGARRIAKERRRVVEIELRKSKSNQEGSRELVRVVGRPASQADLCPVRALETLKHELILRKIASGRIFRAIDRFGNVADDLASDERDEDDFPAPLALDSVARIVKYRVQAAGLDPAPFSSHSLRSGMLTSASRHGASLISLKRHARHKRLETTLGYIQAAEAYKDHAGLRLFEGVDPQAAPKDAPVDRSGASNQST